jgi:hypothetical protein
LVPAATPQGTSSFNQSAFGSHSSPVLKQSAVK